MCHYFRLQQCCIGGKWRRYYICEWRTNTFVVAPSWRIRHAPMLSLPPLAIRRPSALNGKCVDLARVVCKIPHNRSVETRQTRYFFYHNFRIYILIVGRECHCLDDVRMSRQNPQQHPVGMSDQDGESSGRCWRLLSSIRPD